MRVLLLDGYNLIHRAHHGFNKGKYGTVYSFFRSLRVLVEKFKPHKIYFVLEGYPKRRMELLPEYKATRVRADRDKFHEQKRAIIRLMKDNFPVDVVRHEDYECDDVLACLIQHTHKIDDCVVVSSDSDFYQLFNYCSNAEIYNPVRKIMIPKVTYDYVSWKALRGDGSDNIDGFNGIGSKRARKLIESQSALTKFLEDEPGRIEKYNRNCELIRFHDLEKEIDNFEHSSPDVNWKAIKAKFNDMEFFSITNAKSWAKFVTTFDRVSSFCVTSED
jgi:5'-3' exonuclease